jgi:uncharacterized MAPEG superfamily protein
MHTRLLADDMHRVMIFSVFFLLLNRTVRIIPKRRRKYRPEKPTGNHKLATSIANTAAHLLYIVADSRLLSSRARDITVDPPHIMTLHVSALQSTAILSLVLWTKVAATNLGLGGTKMKAGGRAPEDTYQAKAAEATPEAKEAQDRSQRVVNNDLENIPYTMAIAWGAVFCIYFGDDTDKRDRHSRAQIMLYATFVACRILHSVFYYQQLAIARSSVWATGFFCSFALAVLGVFAAFNVK